MTTRARPPGDGLSADFLIIGAGLIGLALAWRLARAGADVLVLDAGRAGAGASAAAAGMLAPGFEGDEKDGLHPELVAFGRESLALWPEFAAELEAAAGADIDLQMNGVLGVALDERDAARFADADGERLTGDEARHLEPALGPAVVAGLFRSEEGEVDPRLAAAALVAAIRRAGGRVLDETGPVELVIEGARASGARGAFGTARAAMTVLATGAGAPRLVAPFAKAPPIFPVKGQIVGVRPTVAPRLVVRGPGAYLAPKRGGRLLIGASEEPDVDDLSLDPQATETLLAAGSRIVPGLSELAPVEARAGLRPATPDHGPIFGPLADGPDGLALAAGHHRNGVLLAPASAEVMAEWLLEGRESAAFQSFRAERFG